jgi:hypothetical protein
VFKSIGAELIGSFLDFEQEIKTTRNKLKTKDFFIENDIKKFKKSA